MLRAAMRFTRGLLGMPLGWQLWVGLLIVLNGVVPLFFWERFEARVVLGVFLAGALLMTLLTALTGFTRLLGLGHVLWVPLLAWLWTRLEAFPADTALGLWLRGLLAVNFVSLVIDAADVIRYLRGERGETVEGLDA